MSCMIACAENAHRNYQNDRENSSYFHFLRRFILNELFYLQIHIVYVDFVFQNLLLCTFFDSH